MPTAQKCCKKQYEIKIFVLHDQNMTKNVTHAPRANHDKGLTKTAKNDQKTHFQRLLTAQKCCKKQYRIKIFVLSEQKSTHAPNANPHKLVEKNIEKRNHQTWGPKC